MVETRTNGFDCCVVWLVALSLLASAACGGRSAQTPPTSTALPSHACGDNCRWYRGEPLATPECRVPEDCGQPPHTQGMQCISGGRCIPICQHHWGDCNDSHRDGCEQAIVDAHYCPGDRRIGAVSEPAIAFFIRDPSPASVEGQRQHLTRSLAGQINDLQACYQASLANNPTLSGSSGYRLTFSDAGVVLTIDQIEPGPGDRELAGCTETALRAAKISEENVGARAFIVEVSYDPGGPDAD
jgi:hypothetical protein